MSPRNEKLIQARQQHGLSQKQLAEQLGVSDLTIGRWERGETNPTLQLRRTVCEFLGMSAEELGLVQSPPLVVTIPSIAFPHICSIPYPRNFLFTGREEILSRIHTQLRIGQAMAISQPQAINGLGGVGKTQIAIEYAYRYRQDYPIVLWTRADTYESLTSGYVTIAKLLNLPEWNEQDQAKTIQAVLQWLSTHIGWLLILDNADELALAYQFLPPTFGGHLLLTTRAQATGIRAHRIEVESMPQDVGALFLLRRAKLLGFNAPLEDAPTADVTIARQICEELGGLPLALDQAGAYIEEMQCGLTGYRSLYGIRRSELLKVRGSFADGYPESVATTWSLSFEKVKQRCPASINLIRLCSFLHSDAIPEELIREGIARWGPILQQDAPDTFALDQIIAELLKFSLVKRSVANNTLSLHRLVQVVVLDTMSQLERDQWLRLAIAVLDSVFPEVEYTGQSHLIYGTGSTSHVITSQFSKPCCTDALYRPPENLDAIALVEYTTWNQCERLLPHALLCLESIAVTQEDLVLASVAYKAAQYLHERGRYIEAGLLFERLLRVQEQQLGLEHAEVASTTHYLAVLYQECGKYGQAASLFQRALSIWEQQLGPDHPLAIHPLNNLALLYRIQGKYEEAESLYQQALSIWEQQLGPVHPNVVYTLSALACLYHEQGKYTQSEPFWKRALHIREQQSGPEHHEVAYPLLGLVILYRDLGKYAQAEPLFQRAQHIRGQQQGLPVYPLSSLARLYREQGKYAAAEPLLWRSLSVREYALRYQDKLLGLESVYEQELRIWEQQLVKEHPYVANYSYGLAAIYKEQGKYAQAELLFQRALRIWEQKWGPEHPDMAYPLNGLANLYREQGRYAQAEPLFQQALYIREQQLGLENPDVAHPLNGLANLYKEQGKYAQAEPLFRRAISICEKQLGPEHPNVATSLHNLAELYRAQGRYEQAEPLHQRALAIREKVLGPLHPDIARSLYNLTELYRAQGKYEQAEPLHQRALAIREKALKPKQPGAEAVWRNSISLLRAMGCENEAKQLEAEILRFSK